MFKKLFFPVFAIAFAVCAYSNVAQAATGYFTQNISGKITVLNCPAGQTRDSSKLEVTVRESNIPDGAVVTKVVFKSAGIADSSGGVVSTEAILSLPNGNVVRKAWGSGNTTTFTAAELGSTTLPVLGKWGVQYAGRATLAGTKSHTQLSLEFTYSYPY